jgi:hypothetical protein
MMEELIITKHAKNRAKERLGISKKALLRKIAVARENGKLSIGDNDVLLVTYQDIKYIINTRTNTVMTVIFLNEGIVDSTEVMKIRGKTTVRKCSNKKSLIQERRKEKEKLYAKENIKDRV